MRTANLGILAILALLAAFRPAASAGGSPPRHPKNVLLLMTDEYRAGCFSFLGHPLARTPNLDRLAKGGVVFDHALCAYPVCTASRGALHSGMWPHKTGVNLNVDPDPNPSAGLPADTVLLASVFHDAGYETYHHGKWHIGDVKRHACYNWNSGLGSFPKQDYIPALTRYCRAHRVPLGLPSGLNTYWGWPVFETATMRRFHEQYPKLPYMAGRWTLPLEIDPTTFITDQALADIDHSGGRPLMITWSDPGPHGPHLVQDPYYSRINPADVALLKNTARPDYLAKDPSCQAYDAMGEDGVREYLRCYYGLIMKIDDQIGRILKRLEERGELDDTLIVFTADHGDMGGAHRAAGGKAIWAFYDETVRVPLLMFWPRGIQAGRRVKTLVGNIDIMPTLLDYAGLPIPKQCQGESLRRFIEGREDLAKPGFCEATHPEAVAVRRMIQTQEWKLWFHYQGPPQRLPLPESRPMNLYHLTDDPGEEHNRASDPKFADIRRQLLERLMGWMKATQDPWLKYLPPLPGAGK
jgi:arylsulfatase A-like enzyme